jgi:hypothetical protein
MNTAGRRAPFEACPHIVEHLDPGGFGLGSTGERPA